MIKAFAQNYFKSMTENICYGFATKMQASSTQKTKDSAGRRLGVKKFGGEEVFPNDILIRQRGFRWKPGQNTSVGKDHTIHSKAEGIVYFRRDPYKFKKTFYVDVIPRENPNRTHYPPPPYSYHPELFPELAKNNPEPLVLLKQREEEMGVEVQIKQQGFKISAKQYKPIEVPNDYKPEFSLSTLQQQLSINKQ